MAYKKFPIWSIEDLAKVAKERQLNRFNFNIAWVGPPGSSKSTGSLKFCYKIGKYEVESFGQKYIAGNFKLKKNLIYDRKDLLDFQKKEYFKVIQADEMIRAGYNRDFQNREQKELIKIYNMYRDHFNITSMCIPFFYDLDPDFRSLIKVRIDLIKRGIGLVHMQNQSLYSNDPWDTLYNKKIEERWKSEKVKTRNYWELTTFRGILFFGTLSPKTELKYEMIKAKKKGELQDNDKPTNDKNTFYENLLNMLKDGNMTREDVQKICLLNSQKYTNVIEALNRRLRNDGSSQTVRQLFKESVKKIDSPNISIIKEPNQRISELWEGI